MLTILMTSWVPWVIEEFIRMYFTLSDYIILSVEGMP
jgi:hypothetical protein